MQRIPLNRAAGHMQKFSAQFIGGAHRAIDQVAKRYERGVKAATRKQGFSREELREMGHPYGLASGLRRWPGRLYVDREGFEGLLAPWAGRQRLHDPVWLVHQMTTYQLTWYHGLMHRAVTLFAKEQVISFVPGRSSYYRRSVGFRHLPVGRDYTGWVLMGTRKMTGRNVLAEVMLRLLNQGEIQRIIRRTIIERSSRQILLG